MYSYYAQKFKYKFDTIWGDIETNSFYSSNVIEDTVCIKFNPISADWIFRTAVLDPVFRKQYEPQSRKTTPNLWNMEEGYTVKTTTNYPLKSLDKGIENGLHIFFYADKKEFQNIDTICQKDPQTLRIALHHPADVVSKHNFIMVPFNKSITLMVKPKVTKTSESLRTYAPTV
jgi:hypothetical protein